MALAGRPPRRSSGGGRRILVVGVVLTLAILFIDASFASRSPQPLEQLSAGAWIDRVLPMVTASTEQGDQIAVVRANGLTMTAATIDAQLGQAASGARATYRQALGLKPPATQAAASGLLEATLQVRAQAATSMATAMSRELASSASSSTTSATVGALAAAAGNFDVSDRTYQLFAHDLPGVGVTPPPSVWLPSATAYTAAPLTVWLQALHSTTNATPVHQVTIESVSTRPPPVGIAGTPPVQQFAPLTSLTVTVVVADTGNQPERDLTVQAAVAPGGAATTSREFVSLTPGAAHSLVLGPLDPTIGVPVTLTITVTGPTGSTTPVATNVITLTVAAPPPPTTTTTTPPTTAAPAG